MAESVIKNNTILLRGTTNSSEVTLIDYPQGYNQTNTMVLSAVIANSNDMSTGSFYSYADADVFFIAFDYSKIRIVCKEAILRGKLYKILLTRI